MRRYMVTLLAVAGAGVLAASTAVTSTAKPSLTNFGTSRPRIVITSPHKTRQPDYTLTGKIEDAAAITSLSYSVNGGAEAALDVSNPFRVVFSLPPGNTQITIAARDAAGHVGTADISVGYTVPAPSQAAPEQTLPTPVRKMLQEQMKKMKQAMASSPQPGTLPSASQSLAKMQSGIAAMKKALAAAGVTMTAAAGDTSADARNPPPKPVDDMAPVLDITSLGASQSVQYTLTGMASDASGVASLSYTLNGGKPRGMTIKHDRFASHLTLNRGVNTVLVAAADAGGNTVSREIRVVVMPATSSGLIDAAVKHGKLDRNTALLYNVYAEFGDARLPSRYRGYSQRAVDNHALDQVALRFHELSATERHALMPFLIPPYYQGSWASPASRVKTAAQRRPSASRYGSHRIVSAVFRRYENSTASSPGWRSAVTGASMWHAYVAPASETVTDTGAGMPACVQATQKECASAPDWKYIGGKHTKVWYRRSKDKGKATQLLIDIEGRIRPRLCALMGRAPMSDLGRPYNGGDGRLDVALVGSLPKGTLGLTVPYVFSPYTVMRLSPVFIELNRDLDITSLRDDMSHEFMHALQWTYDTKGWLPTDYSWLMESTATWSIDYVYHGDNWEHTDPNDKAAEFLNNPGIPLEAKDLPGETDEHSYAAYLFFLYLADGFSPNWIPAVWEATEHAPNSIQAVQKGLNMAGKTDLNHRFPEFAIRNWNTKPEAQYHTWDGIVDRAAMQMKKSVKVAPGRSTALPITIDLKHLTAAYYDFRFPSSSHIRTLAVYNGYGYRLTKKIRAGVGVVKGTPASADVWAIDALPAAESKTRHLEALVKDGGEWERNVKTGKAYTDVGPGMIYCHDPSEGLLSRIVLIASNSHLPGNGSEQKETAAPSMLIASNMACGPWAGTVHQTLHYQGSRDVWHFDTTFHNIRGRPAKSQLLPAMTDAQLRRIGHLTTVGDSGGVGLPAAGGSGVGGLFGTGSLLGQHVGGMAGPHFNPYMGFVMWFLEGKTKWSVTTPCGTSKGVFKVWGDLLTYNFVPSGQLRRHYLLSVGPVPAIAMSGLPHSDGDGTHCEKTTAAELGELLFTGEVDSNGLGGHWDRRDGGEDVKAEFHLDNSGVSTTGSANVAVSKEAPTQRVRIKTTGKGVTQ